MIKSALVLAIGLATTLACRRRSAAFRHWVLAATFACAALMPLIAVVAPAWQVPWLRASQWPLAQPLALGDVESAAPAEVAVRTVAGGIGPSLPTVLWTIWACGVAFNAFVLLVGVARLQAIARRARPVDAGSWANEAVRLTTEWRLACLPSIRQTDHPTLLFTCGWRNPKVLLPQGADAWSEERIRIVLGHEFAHIRRADWLVQIGASLVRSAYWFNPLAWVACWRLRLESDRACDDVVLRVGVAAPDYADALLDLARLFRHGRRGYLPAPTMARPSDLERRVRMLLNPAVNRSPVSRSSLVFVPLALVACMLPVAGLSLSAANAPGAGARSSSSVPTDVVLRPEPRGVASVRAEIAAAPTAAIMAATRPAAAASTLATPAPAVAVGPHAAASSTLTIVVVDERGRTVPAATIDMSSPSAPNVQVRTGPNGEATVTAPTGGSAELSVSMPGFKRYKATVPLDAARTELRVMLQIGALSETVSVAGVAGSAASETPQPRARVVGAAPADDPCSRTTDGGCILLPLKLVDASPIYPPVNLANGLAGQVVIDARVLADGSVGNLQPVPGGDPEFVAAATEAMRLWKFSPVHLDGTPIDMSLRVTVRFELERR